MKKCIKTTLKASAVIIGIGSITFSFPSNMDTSQSYIVAKAATQQDTSESMQQDKKLDDCWEYNEKTKTLKVKSYLSQIAEHDEIFQNYDTSGKFDGKSPWDSYSKEIEKVIVEEGTKSLPLAIFSGLTNLKEINLPSTLTELPKYVFYDCSSLEKVEIPDSVTSIGYEAFFNCKNLKELTIGKGVSLIKGNAFGNCDSLENIILSKDNLYFSIQDGILYDKQMKTLILVSPKSVDSVTIPETVETIGELSFANCKKLKQIHIPSNVKEISDGAFYNCISLKSITFEKNSKCQKISDFVASYGDHSSDTYEESVSSDEIFGAFENCQSLTKLSFPNSLKTIGHYTLTNCTSLKSIYFGSKFEKAFNEKFENISSDSSFFYYKGLTNLTTITVSSQNKMYSSTNGILFNKSKTKLVCYPQNKKEKVYKLPASVKEIEIRAFQDNRILTTLNLSSVEKIYERAFYNCQKLKSVQWSKKSKAIEYNGFAFCKKLKDFTSYGNNLTVGEYAFYNCQSLKSITLKSGTRYINEHAFSSCAAQKVTIPSSVKNIGYHAFGYYEDFETETNYMLKNSTIYCKKNSSAHKYAKANKFKYKFY